MSIVPSTLREIKKMFACEHVVIVENIFGVHYEHPKTHKSISKSKALRILSGDY
jgi:hypothetical protein